MVTSPSGPSASPWVSVISVPAGPSEVSRTRPLMFWPRSTTCTPGRISVTDTGRSSSTARTGGAGDVTSASYPRSLTETGCQSWTPTSRRSSRCPSIRSAARMCVADHCQVSSVPTTDVVPSSCSSSSWARNAVSVPHWSVARVMPTWPRYHPSASSAPSVCAPTPSRSVTS